MEAEANVPFLLALLICDYVIIEAVSNKKSAIGIFDNLWAEAIPVQQRIGILARLTDMEGQYALSIKVVRIEGDSEHLIVKGEFAPVIVVDRLHKIDLALNLPSVQFPAFGAYEIQLFANDIFLGRASLNVQKMENQAK
jgi:hypothetical protein